MIGGALELVAQRADRLILACLLVIQVGVPDVHIIHLHLPAEEDMVDEQVQGIVGDGESAGRSCPAIFALFGFIREYRV